MDESSARDGKVLETDILSQSNGRVRFARSPANPFQEGFSGLGGQAAVYFPGRVQRIQSIAPNNFLKEFAKGLLVAKALQGRNQPIQCKERSNLAIDKPI